MDDDVLLLDILAHPDIGDRIASCLDSDSKAALRFTCTTAKSAIDPTLTKVWSRGDDVDGCHYDSETWPDLDVLSSTCWTVRDLTLAFHSRGCCLKALSSNAFNSSSKTSENQQSCRLWSMVERLTIDFNHCWNDALKKVARLDLPALKSFTSVACRIGTYGLELLLDSTWWAGLEELNLHVDLEVSDDPLLTRLSDLAAATQSKAIPLKMVKLGGAFGWEKTDNMLRDPWLQSIETLVIDNIGVLPEPGPPWRLDILARAPLESLRRLTLLSSLHEHCCRVAALELGASTWLPRLVSLDIQTSMDSDDAALLAALPLVSLVEFRLSNDRFPGSVGAFLLAQPEWLWQLRTLSFRDTPSFDACNGIQGLLHYDSFECLESLDLAGCGLQRDSVQQLVELQLPALKVLHLSSNPEMVVKKLPAKGGAFWGFFRAPWFPQLEVLNLKGSHIGDLGFLNLCRVPFTCLKELNVADCRLTGDGLAHLATASWALSCLDILDLSANPLGGSGIKLLASKLLGQSQQEQAGLSALKELHLKYCGLGSAKSEGWSALAALPLPTLRYLAVGDGKGIPFSKIQKLSKEASWWRVSLHRFEVCGEVEFNEGHQHLKWGGRDSQAGSGSQGQRWCKKEKEWRQWMKDWCEGVYTNIQFR